MLDKTLGAALAVVTAVAACGTTALPAGAVCTQAADCESGLDCLGVPQFTGSACTVIGKSCSIVCIDDSTCASLGSNFKCFTGCNADNTCEEVAP